MDRTPRQTVLCFDWLIAENRKLERMCLIVLQHLHESILPTTTRTAKPQLTRIGTSLRERKALSRYSRGTLLRLRVNSIVNDGACSISYLI